MKKCSFIFYLVLLSGCSTITPAPLQGLDNSINQAIFVHPVKGNSSQARLSAWQKQDTKWRRLFSTRADIGRNGLAIAAGKKEGDGKTPSGIYPLGPAFGYGGMVHTGLDYHQISANDFWVDDPQSLQYNQLVIGTPQARSFETMKRQDNLYQYGVVIGYNTHPIIPGAGSAIFLHVWRGVNRPTAGCVALPRDYMLKILGWLNKQSQPVIIME